MTTHLDSEMNRMSKLEMQGRGDPLWCHLGCRLHCIKRRKESVEGQVGFEVHSEGRDIITPFCNSYRGLDAGRCLHAKLASVSAPFLIHRKLLCIFSNTA